MTTTAATRTVGLDELRRAWHAVEEGQFLSPRPLDRGTIPRPTEPPVVDDRVWCPGETVLPVVGCLPQAGVTSLALAIATHATPARVIECSLPIASGLVGAATAELGATSSGWTVGRRDQVHLARPSALHRSARELPLPDDAAAGTVLSVLDIGWNVGQLLASDGWLSAAVDAAPQVVVAGTATVPGLRRLESALTLLDPARTVVAMRGGPDPRRWPRELATAMGPATRDQHRAGRWVGIPHDRRFALRGIDSNPLPSALVAAAGDVLRHVGAAGHPPKGTS